MISLAVVGCSNDDNAAAPDAGDGSHIEVDGPRMKIDCIPVQADAQPSPVSSLTALTTSPGGGLLVSTRQGELLRFDGASWRKEATNINLPILSIATTGAKVYLGVGEDYAVGEQQGGLYERAADGSYQLLAQVKDHNQRNASVRRVLADGSSVWAFGDKGAFARFDGTKQTYLLPDESLGHRADDAKLAAGRLYVASMGKLYAGGAHEPLQLVFDPTSPSPPPWHAFGAEKSFDAVAATAQDDVFVAGLDQTSSANTPFIAHFDGTDWTISHTPSENVRALFARSATEVYASGANGMLLRFDGTSWKPIATGISASIISLTGEGTGPLYLLTTEAVYRYDGPGAAPTAVYRANDKTAP
ncbi:MAG: hypothetical protein CSA65_07815 [Proteobacteria bacterium]|nr:MAG: hypothetical protein CSA65_07815 [Pseudomonadota bacterium]